VDGLDLSLLFAAAYNAALRDDTNTYARMVIAEVECVDVPQVWERCDHPVRATWREVQGMRAIWPRDDDDSD